MLQWYYHELISLRYFLVVLMSISRFAKLGDVQSVLAELTTKLKFPLQTGRGGVDVSPSMHWPDPVRAIEPELEHGPVLVQIEYKIDPAHQYEFALAAKDLGSISKRDGVFLGIFRHDRHQDVFIDSFLIESWTEHLRQHERITIVDRLVEGKGNKPFIAESLESTEKQFK